MIKSKEDYLWYLERDRCALGISKSKSNWFFTTIRDILFPNPIFKFNRTLRKLEYIENVEMKSSNRLVRIKGRGRFLVYKIIFRRISMKLGFSISPNCFGPGLSIAHYGTIIVNENARIGANCRLHGCVNIGSSGGNNKAPIIGDNVYIGPSAVIFGDIYIADNISIGANATVNKTFDQPNVVLVGTPAKIVKTNAPNWLEKRNKD